MAELLVLFACINSTGCPETSSLYYDQHPAFRQELALREGELERELGTFTVQYAAPILGVAAGRQYTAKIYNNLYFGFNKNFETLTFRREF